jgi:PTS system galactitol-specific IIB component
MTKKSAHSGVFTIIVSCGTAIATSTHVAIKLKELLSERGIKIHTIQCRVPEVPDYADNADLVISTAQVPYQLDIPVIDGIPFLSGIGVKEVIDKIEETLLADRN